MNYQPQWWYLEYDHPEEGRKSEICHAFFFNVRCRQETLAVGDGCKHFYFRPATSAEILEQIARAKREHGGM